MESKYNDIFGIAYDKSRNEQIGNYTWVQKPYEGIKIPTIWGHMKDTGVPKEFLTDLGLKIC
jgi:2-oxoglutarate dehydrogenase E1 component